MRFAIWIYVAAAVALGGVASLANDSPKDTNGIRRLSSSEWLSLHKSRQEQGSQRLYEQELQVLCPKFGEHLGFGSWTSRDALEKYFLAENLPPYKGKGFIVAMMGPLGGNGIQLNDIITHIGSIKLESPGDVHKAAAKLTPGKPVALKLKRLANDGKKAQWQTEVLEAFVPFQDAQVARAHDERAAAAAAKVAAVEFQIQRQRAQWHKDGQSVAGVAKGYVGICPQHGEEYQTFVFIKPGEEAQLPESAVCESCAGDGLARLCTWQGEYEIPALRFPDGHVTGSDLKIHPKFLIRVGREYIYPPKKTGGEWMPDVWPGQGEMPEGFPGFR